MLALNAFGEEVIGYDHNFTPIMFFVYIIYSTKLDKYYVGHTENLEKRILEHNNGLSDFTSKASDWEMKYSKAFENRALARNAEILIKKKKSRKYIEWLILQ